MIDSTQIFFSDEVGRGGISTNVIALAQHVKRSGGRPIIIPVKWAKSELWKPCSGFADIVRPRIALKAMLCSRDVSFVLFANSVRTVLLSFLFFILLRLNRKRVKVLFAVYNPWEFSRTGIWQKCYRSMIKILGLKNIFFMNGACLEHHQRASPDFTYVQKFLPLVKPELPLDMRQSVVRESNCILTVGRFVGFKMHYLRALIIYAKAHPEIAVNIVGYGEGEGELRGMVQAGGVANVHFLGMIDYPRLTQLYQSASCYVGMGTTLVEASSYGAPCVVAVAGVPGDVSYGYFTAQTEYDMGEYRPTKHLLALSDVLDDFFSLSLTQRNDLSVLHKSFADQFSLVKIGAAYDALIKDSESNFLHAKALWVYFVFIVSTIIYFARWAINGKKSRYDIPYV
jgi:hypothetical protein